ncbi:MAG: type IX secretion system outer membrane channel protein PorV [Ginsengibacter sp.]
MKNATLKFAALAFLIGSSCTLIAQTNRINVVTSAVPFLRISPDARSGGMGDVGIATAPDANSSFWNQGKIPFAVSKAAIAVTYTPWLKGLDLNDVYLASLAGYYQLDELQSISGSMRYFSLGNIQFTDAYGNDLNTFRPREFSIDAGYARKLSDNLGLGIALRYINSSLASGTYGGQSYKPGSAVCADLSIFHDGTASHEDGSGFNWGATLTNLGTKISYSNDATQKDYIPANLGLGIAYTKVFDETSKATFALDVNKLLVPTPPLFSDAGSTAEDSIKLLKYHNQGVVSSWFSSFGDAPGGFAEEVKEFQVSVGAEYMYNNQFALRAGYFYEAPTKGDRKYFTLGVGLNYNMFGLNFSYLIPSGSGVNRNPLSNTLRFSLIFNLDKDTNLGTAE